MISFLVLLQVAAATPPTQSDVEATALDVTVSMKSESPGPIPGAPGSKTRMTVSGNGVRFDRIEGTSPHILSVNPDAYAISNTSGYYVVDSVRREFSRIEVAQMAGMVQDAVAALENFNMKMNASKFEVDSLGPGEPVFGYPTQRWRMRQSLKASLAVGSDNIEMSIDNTIESLYAPGVAALVAAALAGQDSIMKLETFGGLIDGAALDSMLAQYKRLPPGLPIRSTAKSTSTMPMGSFSVTTTTEVSKIEKVRLPASLFDVPKGYKEIEFDFSMLKPPGG